MIPIQQIFITWELRARHHSRGWGCNRGKTDRDPSSLRACFIDHKHKRNLTALDVDKVYGKTEHSASWYEL